MEHHIAAPDVVLDFNVINVGVDIGVIESVLIVVALIGIRHTHDAADGLDLESFDLDVAEHEKDLSPWAIPAQSDGLLENQDLNFVIILFYVR